MPSSTWPTGVDLEPFLEGAGLTVPSGADLDALVAAAVARFKRRVDHGPFLAEGVAQTIRHDPPGPKPTPSNPARRGGGTLLFLKRSMATITQVRTGYVDETDTGTLLERYTDYDLEPEDGGEGEKPVTRVRFYQTQYGRPASVAVVGLEGYATEIPDDVWALLLELAGAAFCRQVKQGIASGVIAWKDGDEEERYSIELLQKLGDEWEASAKAAMHAFRRVD